MSCSFGARRIQRVRLNRSIPFRLTSLRGVSFVLRICHAEIPHCKGKEGVLRCQELISLTRKGRRLGGFPSRYLRRCIIGSRATGSGAWSCCVKAMSSEVAYCRLSLDLHSIPRIQTSKTLRYREQNIITERVRICEVLHMEWKIEIGRAHV